MKKENKLRKFFEKMESFISIPQKQTSKNMKKFRLFVIPRFSPRFALGIKIKNLSSLFSFSLILTLSFVSLISPIPFAPKEAQAAISAVTARGSTVTGTGNQTSISVTPTGNITVGKMAFFAIATDNSQTTDNCDNAGHQVTDTAGNTWTSILQCTETDGAADDGVKISLFATKVTTQISTTDSVTVTFGSARSDNIAMLFEATVGAGNTLEVAQIGTGQNSLTAAVSSLTSREYLFLYHAGAEGEDSAKTPTTNYTELFDLLSSTSGALDVNISAYVQTRIATLTSSSALPTAWTFTNAMSSLTALFEQALPTLSIAQPDGVSDSVAVGTSYNITYTLADSDDVVTTAFYYDTNTDMTGGTAITGPCATAAEGTNATCSWDTTGVTAGSYYIYGVVTGDGGIGGGVTAVSSGQITLTDPAVTTIGSGTDPSTQTIAPGASIVDAGSFTLQTDTGSDSVTALTVSLANSGTPYDGVSEVRITSNDGSTTYFSAASNPSSNTVNFSGGTPIPVTTSQTPFKIRVTPKTHANMPAVPGASYAINATTTAFTSTNSQAGSDTNTNTLTIDNLSPGNVTSATATGGDTVVNLAWTNPVDADLSRIMVLASTSAITFTPVEGTTYATSTLSGNSRVACYGLQVSCSDTSLSNGTAYYYKIFTLDSNGNWSDAGVTPAGSPVTPVVSQEQVALDQLHYRWRNDSGAEDTAAYPLAEDTAVSGNLLRGDRIRLRFLVSNTGTGSASNYTYRLETASTSCSAWIAVPNTETENPHWIMDPSAFVLNSALTTDSSGLTNPGGKTFASGYVMTTQNTTPALTLTSSQFTEIEYSIRSTAYATAGTTYCFRLTNGGSASNFTYTTQPQASVTTSIVRPEAGGVGIGGETSGSGTQRTGGGSSGGSSLDGGGGGNPVGGGGPGGGGGGDIGFLYLLRNYSSLLFPRTFIISYPNLGLVYNILLRN